MLSFPHLLWRKPLLKFFIFLYSVFRFLCGHRKLAPVLITLWYGSVWLMGFSFWNLVWFLTMKCALLLFQDYHVIFIHQTSHGAFVYDLDSVLAFPCDFSEYIDQTVRTDDDLRPEFHRWITCGKLLFKLKVIWAFYQIISEISHFPSAADSFVWCQPQCF